MTHYEPDTSAVHMVRDNNKCILCRRCVAVCENGAGRRRHRRQRAGASPPISAPAFEHGRWARPPACHCGQCIAACPTGALYEKDNTADVLAAIAWMTHRSMWWCRRPPLSGLLWEKSSACPSGTNVEGKMAAALRRLGFDRVFDTDFARRPDHHGGGHTSFWPGAKRRGTCP